ncbi:ATP-binding protein [Paraeggerthella sp.]|uniref:ATP-binding protein n=1 Tax=Paraeggerthella sp. TaxID=2897350 RepID=UPI003AB4ADC1
MGAGLAFADESPDRAPLRVLFPQVEGFSMTDEDGSHRGLVVDYLNEIAKYTGWEYEYVTVSDDFALSNFTSGEYDLLGGTYYVAAAASRIAYPEYSCGPSKSVLFSRWDDGSIRGYDYADLNGKTIAVSARATENVRRLEGFLATENIDCTIKKYTIDEFVDGSLEYLLDSGEVDLLLGNAVDNTGAYRPAAIFDGQPHYLVTTPENQDVLDGLNWALEHIMEANPNFAEEAYARNFPDADINMYRVNHQERLYVEKKKSITVALPCDYSPLSVGGNSEDGRVGGVVYRFLDRIEAFSGLNVDCLYVESYSAALDALRSGQVDMLGFFLGDEDDAAQAGLALSSSYATFSNLVARNKLVAYPSENLRYVALEGTQIPSDVPTGDVRYVKSEHEALNMVDKGQADVVFGLSVQIEGAMQQGVYSNVVPVSLTGSATDICFALPRPADPDLLTIVNKSLNSMSVNEKAAAVEENRITAGYGTLTLVDYLSANPMLVAGLAAVTVLLILAIAVGVTRSRVRAADMRVEAERVAAEGRAKSEFLSRMSHEIRTPMNAVVGITDVLDMQKDDPEALRKNIARLRASSDYLLSLLNDVLDTSRVENGMMDIAYEPFSLTENVAELQDMMQAQADARIIDLQVVTKVSHEGVVGDSLRLKQVLSNLLSNAIKFTPEGGVVRLVVEETGFDGERATFFFGVADSGVGISPEDQRRIFNAFAQVGSAASKSQGTGLGLPLCQSLVRLMGGELQVRSELGSGSEFSFSLVFAMGTPEPRRDRSVDRELFKGFHILLVEDGSVNAAITTNVLELHGARVTWAIDGRQAVDLFAASRLGEFDAVLMDMRMPVMDGVEATRAIRLLPRSDAREIPIVAMTANAFKESEDAARDAGMNEFVTKPLDIDEVFDVLGRLLKR